MDIWAWLQQTTEELDKQGHARLAQLIDDLPSEVVDDRHANADAIFAEALTLARGLDLKWVEVFLRHWHLQSRVFHRMDATALPDAVSLVEFAHRADTKECPQSVCAVQDLAACYGFVDGPGYVDERIAVAKETLARITPAWPCFVCIGTEYADALRDDGRAEEALRMIEQHAVERARHVPNAAHDYDDVRADMLLSLGRNEEALAALDRADRHARKDDNHAMERRLDRALANARLGRFDDAKRVLPPYSDIAPTPSFYKRWTDAVAELARRGQLENSWQLGEVLTRIETRLESQAVVRTTFEIAQTRAELAVARGAREVAEHALGTMERLLPKLRKSLDANDRIGRTRALIDALPPTSIALPATAEALVAELRANPAPNPERDLALLRAGVAAWPDSSELTNGLAYCLDGTGRTAEATDVLQKFVDGGHLASDVLMHLANRYVAQHQRDAVAKLAKTAEAASDRTVAPWIRGFDAYMHNELLEAERQLTEVAALMPDALNTRRMLADCGRRQHRYADMLRWLSEVVAQTREAGPDDWDLMIAATMLERWDVVRTAAQRLGMPVSPGDGAIDEAWGYCRIRYFRPDGSPLDLAALRTGPVTARIVELVDPQDPEMTNHFGDTVVFDARPQNAPPETEEEKARHLWVYPFEARTRVTEHQFFFIEGYFGGQSVWDDFRTRVRDLGGEAQRLSSDHYQHVPPDGGQPVPGIYAVLALSPAVMQAGYALLRDVARGLPRPWLYPTLAHACGDEPTAAAHRAELEGMTRRDAAYNGR